MAEMKYELVRTSSDVITGQFHFFIAPAAASKTGGGVRIVTTSSTFALQHFYRTLRSLEQSGLEGKRGMTTPGSRQPREREIVQHDLACRKVYESCSTHTDCCEDLGCFDNYCNY
nr:kappa-theraphotoxin-Cg1c-like [Dermacentor andersoni]